MSSNPFLMKYDSTAKAYLIDKLAPVNVVLIHETIEHILLTREQLRKPRMVTLEGVLVHEEREDQ